MLKGNKHLSKSQFSLDQRDTVAGNPMNFWNSKTILNTIFMFLFPCFATVGLLIGRKGKAHQALPRCDTVLGLVFWRQGICTYPPYSFLHWYIWLFDLAYTYWTLGDMKSNKATTFSWRVDLQFRYSFEASNYNTMWHVLYGITNTKGKRIRKGFFSGLGVWK